MSHPPPSDRATSGTAVDWSAGPVTRSGRPYPAAGADAGPPTGPPTGPGVGSGRPPTDPGRGGRDGVRLWWFGGAAAVVLAGGLVAVLVLVLSGNPDPFGSPDLPPDVRPPLAQLCPGPTGGPGGQPTPADPTPGPTLGPALPEPTGPRTVDPDAGISYTEYGEPWRPWSTVWNAGALQVPYKVGQHFVTEADYNGFSDYHASILSAAVPAADNDALSLDLECVGRQVAADVRAEYYPQPNRMDLIRDERTPIGGRPAWLTVFRLHFTQPGLQATDELVAVACIDVGRPTAAVLFVSIPGTHRELDWVVDDLYASVRVE
ncbi:hypothetical protein O7543_14180 [Solwaraspora sp. WMMA2080]|uniref:hypothetical protein n=1 Tax=unclassified Solwaraspora TaxID=2627926 RepID=UPI00248BF042|nr:MULTISPECIES: hypothetical protein [unclassified Solwaraspora]WBB97976.1 hypothetical protein O7553_03175 [Solwaraspora sp. WMMA2059]WBC23465.1 hypothetical protein O7543_14180 [Solwaraspora sp. WMMA2080]